MAGLPVTIRLLDPPLHEFLPHADAEMAGSGAAALGTDVETIRRRAAELAEANPMLGHRGCRLGISYPEIYEMQARAIFEGALAVAKETGNAAASRGHDPADRARVANWRSPAPRWTRWRRRCSPRPAQRSSTASAP